MKERLGAMGGQITEGQIVYFVEANTPSGQLIGSDSQLVVKKATITQVGENFARVEVWENAREEGSSNAPLEYGHLFTARDIDILAAGKDGLGDQTADEMMVSQSGELAKILTEVTFRAKRQRMYKNY